MEDIRSTDEPPGMQSVVEAPPDIPGWRVFAFDGFTVSAPAASTVTEKADRYGHRHISGTTGQDSSAFRLSVGVQSLKGDRALRGWAETSWMSSMPVKVGKNGGYVIPSQSTDSDGETYVFGRGDRVVSLGWAWGPPEPDVRHLYKQMIETFRWSK